MRNISTKDREVNFSDRFNKQLQQSPDEVKAAFTDALLLFLSHPFHPALRNHELKGKFAGYRSFDVTGDYRALFREDDAGNRSIVKFYQFGTHKELYE